MKIYSYPNNKLSFRILQLTKIDIIIYIQKLSFKKTGNKC